MSRLEQFDDRVAVDETDEIDEDVAMWNRMGRAAMFFCIWSAMALPILLIIAVR